MSTFGGLTAIFAAAFMFSSIVPATTFADDLPSASSDLDVAVSVTPVISIRTLDSTATSPISSLDFNILPSAAGTRTTQTTVVDVSTSNVSGYNLLMQSDYQNGANYTTDLVHADPTIATTTAGQIPTATTATVSATSYWNYSKSWNETLGPTGNTSDFSSSSIATSAKDNQLIPAHGTPATIRNDVDIATASSKTNIDVNINIATDKTAGSYKNRLLFTAIANPIPVDFTLTFDKNTQETVTNLPNPITDTSVASNHTFTIPNATSMSRNVYTFVGWSTSPSERQGNGSGPDGLYVAGDTIIVPVDGGNGNPDYSQHGTGSMTLYAVWLFPCAANSICYAPNGDGIDGTMDNQTIVFHNSTDTAYTSISAADTTALSSSSTEVTLLAPNFARPGYGFIGWNTKEDGTGTMYGPNQTLTTSDGSLTAQLRSDLGTKGIVLYSQWRPSAGNMQNWSGCSSMNIGDVTALTDNRTDAVNTSKTYAVAKLLDGKCWMTENLRYTDNATNTSPWQWKDGIKEYNFSNITEPDSARSPIDNTTATGSRWHSYGGYYTWAAANDTTSTDWEYGQNAPAPGICPAGWRVPTSESAGGDLAGLSNATTDVPTLYLSLMNSVSATSARTFVVSNAFRSYPNNFVLSGDWGGGTSEVRGGEGRYWTSAKLSSSSYCFFLRTSLVNNPNCSSGSHYGLTVRCVID